VSHPIKASLLTSFTKFFKVIHVVILPQTQGPRSSLDPNINNTQGVSYHISKKQINKDIIKINYESIYNIVQLNAIHITSPLYHLKFIFQSPITIHVNHTLWSRRNNTHQFHNRQLTNVI